MKYKLIIFDLDGTLLDTLEDLADSTNYALRACGLPERSIDEVRQFVGNGIYKLIERAVPDELDEAGIEKVFEVFKAYYGNHCNDKTKAYNGIMKMLHDLRQNSVRIAVVSNKADFAVQALCRQYFDGLLDMAVGEREHIRRKPAPDAVNEVLRVLGFDRKDAVYVGDSDVDIETAHNAEMECISVTWGFRDAALLKAHGAQILVDTPADLELQFK
jgi:phosphoglycolate phosphatase